MQCIWNLTSCLDTCMFTCTGYVCPVIMYVGRPLKRGWTRTLKAFNTGEARTAPRTRKQASSYSPQPTSTFVCMHTLACKHTRGWVTCARSHVQIFVQMFTYIYLQIEYLYIFMHTYLCIDTCIVHADCACRFSQPPAKKTTDSSRRSRATHAKIVYVVYIHIYIYTNIHTY